MLDRPKPSSMPGTRVSGVAELVCDHCRARENCARKWLTGRHETALVRDAISSQRTGWVHEDVIRARVSRGIEPQRELIARRNVHVQLGESGMAQEFGRIEPCLLGQLPGGRKHKTLIVGLKIARCKGPSA